MDHSELVATFCSITAASSETAEQFLIIADNNLEQAVTLFLESGGGGSAGAPSFDQHQSVAPSVEGDEELVRRLQQEEYARAGSDSNQVREAIAPVTETLVDTSYQRPAQIERPREVFGVPEASQEELTPAQNRLAKLFKPPYELIEQVDLETAKELGRDRKKWIIVNIQNATEFQSHVLNRDIWADPDIKKLVKKYFILLQYNHDSPEGQEFKAYYHLEEYPYVSLLDPRTGEELKSWSFQLPDSTDFLEQLEEFLEKNSLDPKSKNPLSSKKKQDLNKMTEEDQIRFAMEKSLGNDNNSSGDDDDDMSYDEYQDFDDDDEADYDDAYSEDGESVPAFVNPPTASASASSSDPVSTTESSKPVSVPSDSEPEEDLSEEDKFALITPDERPEPPNSPLSTRIQFRLADGTRVVKRFLKSDPVRTVFARAKSINETLRYSYFGLNSADKREDLMAVLDKTIEEVGLGNSSLLVELID